MPRYVMAIDASKCLNCKACLIACQQRNAVPYGLSRNWVRETPDTASPSGWRYQPGACMHCDEPSCVDACPTHATYKAEDGVVMVDETRCIACGSCMRACPYQARHIDPARRVVDKCDYCASSRAEGMEPACVSVCTTRARVFGDVDDPQSPVSKVLGSHKVTFVEAEDAPTKPTLAYLNDVADKHYRGALARRAVPVRGRGRGPAPADPPHRRSIPRRKEEGLMIRRHSLSAVCMHWFNAFCWIALLFTGFALLSNPAMQPVGMWWADLWTGVFGAYGLLVFHLLIGSAWLAVYFLYLIFGLRHDVIPFLKEVFSLSPASDMIWCIRKGMRLVLGEKAMRSMGLDPALPPQGFYNAGQKLAAVAAVLCSVGLALSGLFLAALALHLVAPGSEDAAQWALFIHLLCAGVMAVVLPIHIYMAAFAPGEGPALRSMFSGFIPVTFIRHHNPLWYEQLVRKGVIRPETTNTLS